MTTLELIIGLIQALTWPVLIVALLFYYRNKVVEFAIELLGAKLEVKLVKEGEGTHVNKASPAIMQETSDYKLYSNGLLVQNLKLLIAPGIEKLSIVYPITFPNELLTIQVIGEDVAWPVRASLGNCDLKIAPSSRKREIQMKISGI